MIESILIANRAEIAVRVIRSCKDLGIRTVAAYSKADEASLAVQMADEAVCIGGPEAKESYLNSSNLITAACLKRCDAIHPGVGFLSENAAFAEAVEAAGLIFIGPQSETISLLGDKVRARNLAASHGLPIVSGSHEAVEDLETAKAIGGQIGYPLLLKASAGGGGRGMRIVRSEAELGNLLPLARKEAKLFFGDDSILIERYIQQPRHLEVQLLGDGQGNIIALGERDCSVQKNHQKLLEESPAPNVDQSIRDAMMRDAVRLFKALNYRGAGTVEFLFDGKAYYFIEVNARLQVEHPVSELVSGLDLVRQQIRIAGGGTLEGLQDPQTRGWSIECRINAHGCGKLTRFVMPSGPGVRVDTHLHEGATLTPYYDSLMAKVIVHDSDRQMAVKSLLRALDEVVIEGVSTNLEQQKLLIQSRPFTTGRYRTDLYEQTITQETRHG